MVYVNCAARHGGVKTAAPMMNPRQIDEARTAAAAGAGRGQAPRDRHAPLPPDHRHRRGLSDRSDPRRISRPDRAARRALLGPHEAHVQTPTGSSPTPICPARTGPKESSPSPASDLPAGRNLKANLTDATPTILALLGLAIPAHVEGKPIVAPAGLHRPHSPAETLAGPHHHPFEYTYEEQEVIERRLAELGYLE